MTPIDSSLPMPNTVAKTKYKRNNNKSQGKRKNKLSQIWITLALCLLMTAGIWITLMWSELQQLDSVQSFISGGPASDSTQLNYQAIEQTLFKTIELSSLPLEYTETHDFIEKEYRSSQPKLCVIHSAQDAVQSFYHKRSKLFQMFQLLLNERIYYNVELIVGDTLCWEDGNIGPESICDFKIKEGLQQEKKISISVNWLKSSNVKIDIIKPAKLAYQVYEELSNRRKENSCDLLFFATPWLAHYIAIARHQGIDFRNSAIIVYFERNVHSALSDISRTSNGKDAHEVVEHLTLQYMEAASSTLADRVLVGNELLLEELRNQALIQLSKFVLNNKAYSASILPPYIFHNSSVFLPTEEKTEANIVNFVYEGPLCLDNGLESFVEALRLIHNDLLQNGMSANLSFSGEDFTALDPKYRGPDRMSVHKKMGSDFIKESLAHLQGYNVEISSTYSNANADGSLYVILQSVGSGEGLYHLEEAITNEVPFIAYNSTLRAFAESIGLTVSEKELLQIHGVPDPSRDVGGSKLSSILQDIIYNSNSLNRYKPVNDIVQILKKFGYSKEKNLLELHRSLLSKPRYQDKDKIQTMDRILVSVCIVFHNRDDSLITAVHSVTRQTHRNIEVIIVDNASNSERHIEALKSIQQNYKGIRIVTLEKEESLSAARNAGANKAKGEYILFMDDDNIAKSEEIELLLKVALNTNASIVSPGDEYFVEEPSMDLLSDLSVQSIGKWLPIGPAPALGVFMDVFGDANALFKLDTFKRYHGFQDHTEIKQSSEGELAKTTGEDWELMELMVLDGQNLQVLPMPLFWYRLSVDAFSANSSKHLYLKRSINPYVKLLEERVRTNPELNFAISLVPFAQKLYHERPITTPGGEAYEKLLAMLRSQSLHDFKSSCTLEHNQNISAFENLLQNYNFQDERGWEKFGQGGYSKKKEQNGIQMLSNSIAEEHGAKQTVVFEVPVNAPLFIAAESTHFGNHKSNTPDGYSIYLDLEYSDSSMGYGFHVSFSSDSTAVSESRRWKCAVIVPPKPIQKVHFHLLFRHQRGRVIFHQARMSYLSLRDVCHAYIHDALDQNSIRSSSNCDGQFSKSTNILF